jgi:hypothetical protein
MLLRSIGMKRFAYFMLIFYLLFLIIITYPLFILLTQINSGAETDFAFPLNVYSQYQYWVIIFLMVICEWVLLMIPVKLSAKKPVKQRSIILTTVLAGILMTILLVSLIYSVTELIIGHEVNKLNYTPLLVILGIWIFWSVVFIVKGKTLGIENSYNKQMKILKGTSILTVIIAIPSHIIVRSRDYCCAGMFTALGLICGFSVMLLSFGPGIIILYADKIKKKRQRDTG